jgi:hypothetical protein
MYKVLVYLGLILSGAWVGFSQTGVSEPNVQVAQRAAQPRPSVKKTPAPQPTASLAPRVANTPNPAPSNAVSPRPGVVASSRPVPVSSPRPATSPAPSSSAQPQPPKSIPSKSTKRSVKAPRKNSVTPTNAAHPLQPGAPRIGGFGGLVSGRIPGVGIEGFYPIQPIRIGGGFWLGQSQQRAEFEGQMDYESELGDFAVRSLNVWAEYDVYAQWLSIRAGIGYRLLAWEFDIRSNASVAGVVMDANSLCLMGSVGGRYPLIERLLFTYEVVGFSYPLLAKATRTVSASGAFAADIDSLNQNIQNLTDDLAGAVSVHSLMLGLAWLM